MRHQHQYEWEPISGDYNPPDSGPVDGEEPEDILLPLVDGLTVVVQRCTQCGLVKSSYTIPGQAQLGASRA